MIDWKGKRVWSIFIYCSYSNKTADEEMAKEFKQLTQFMKENDATNALYEFSDKDDLN